MSLSQQINDNTSIEGTWNYPPIPKVQENDTITMENHHNPCENSVNLESRKYTSLPELKNNNIPLGINCIKHETNTDLESGKHSPLSQQMNNIQWGSNHMPCDTSASQKNNKYISQPEFKNNNILILSNDIKCKNSVGLPRIQQINSNIPIKDSDAPLENSAGLDSKNNNIPMERNHYLCDNIASLGSRHVLKKYNIPKRGSHTPYDISVGLHSIRHLSLSQDMVFCNQNFSSVSGSRSFIPVYRNGGNLCTGQESGVSFLNI